TAELQRDKPYVSFFVDKEFKSLKNFPPYEYNWDTTKVPNGWHVLEAMTATPDAATPTKARSIHVNVNNPGGQTRKFDNIADLSKDPSAVNTVHGTGVTSSAAAKLPDALTTKIAVPGRIQPKGIGDTRSSDPGLYGMGATSSGSVSISPASLKSKRIAGPSPVTMGAAVKEPKGAPARVSVRQQSLPGVSSAGSILPITSPTKEGSPGLTAIEPGATLTSIAQRTGNSVEV